MLFSIVNIYVILSGVVSSYIISVIELYVMIISFLLDFIFF